MPIPYLPTKIALADRQKAVNHEVTKAIPSFSSALKKKGLCAVLVSLGYTAQKNSQLLTAEEYELFGAYAGAAPENFDKLQKFASLVSKAKIPFPEKLTQTSIAEGINRTLSSKTPQQQELGFSEPSSQPTPVVTQPQATLSKETTPVKPLASPNKETVTAQPIKTPVPTPSMPAKSVSKSTPAVAVTPVTSTPVPVEGRRMVKAASLADILGISSVKPKINPKWQPHYTTLQAQRDQLREDMRDYQDPEITKTGSADIYDMATASMGADQHYKIISQKSAQLQEIESALKRIERNAYGICMITGEPIEAERLLLNPATQYSVEGEKQFQQERRARLHTTSAPQSISAISEETEDRAVDPDAEDIDEDSEPVKSKKGAGQDDDDDLDDVDEPKDKKSDADEPDLDEEVDADDSDVEVTDVLGTSTDDEDLSDQGEDLSGFTVLDNTKDEDKDKPNTPPVKLKKAKRPIMDR
jgi:DnaK suppressor protein